MYYNQIRFDSLSYRRESIKAEAQIIWLPFNSQMSSQIPFKITTTSLELQDEIVNLHDLTELEDESVFTLD